MRLVDNAFGHLVNPHYFGFVQGHSYLDDEKVAGIFSALSQHDSRQINQDFEKQIASLIGPGGVVSFAAARMAFFCLMKHLHIGSGDEVILTGYTCSVMPNAVFKTGATPIFSDIDPNTFGSSPAAIEAAITKKTRMIVAQHSFGIPCDIETIAKICNDKEIFLLEDCSITLGSAMNDIEVGNWGDAAIFSTDHSKPLNTIIGGILYSRDHTLITNIRSSTSSLPDLGKAHQQRLYKVFLFEKRYCNPKNNQLGSVHRTIRSKIGNMLHKNDSYTYLTADYSRLSETSTEIYPYPAQMPTFLAQLGIYEIDHWGIEKHKRTNLLNQFISISKDMNFSEYLPSVYLEDRATIVPSRFVFRHPRANYIRKLMAKYLDVNWFWFLSPIITCSEPADLGYHWGSCPNAEQAGQDIINWPCVLDHKFDDALLASYENLLSILKKEI